MLYDNNLEDIVLHSDSAKCSNKLFVISGYIGPEIISQLESMRPKKFIIIYGMYGMDNISETLHKKLIELDNNANNIEIYYSTVPIHSKLYCWSNDDVINEVLIGSANFTVNGLRKNHKETLHPIPQTSYEGYLIYQKYVWDNSIRCTDPQITFKGKRKVRINPNAPQPLIAYGICRMTLLDKNGLVPKKSSLNWGYQKGHHTVSRSEAYVSIRAEYIKMFPNLFPQKKYVNGASSPTAIGNKAKQNDDVELIWDDGTSMLGLMEGSKIVNNTVYPLQLTSSGDKTIFGRYIRKRIVKVLLLRNKKYAKDLKEKFEKEGSFPITKKILTDYGRTHIDISLIGDGVYNMDFSVNI